LERTELEARKAVRYQNMLDIASDIETNRSQKSMGKALWYARRGISPAVGEEIIWILAYSVGC